MLSKKILQAFRINSLKYLNQARNTSFCTINIAKIDADTQKITHEGQRFNDKSKNDDKIQKFANALNKTYQFEKKRKRAAETRDREFLILSMTSKTPVKDTLRLFETYQSNGFDDENLATCLKFFAKMIKLHGKTTALNMDHSRAEAFEDWRFVDMIEEIKYCSQKGVYVLPVHLADMLESLASLEYRDPKLHKAIIMKISRMAKNEDEGFDPNFDEAMNLPQFQKPKYYTDRFISFTELAKNSEFNNQMKELFEYADNYSDNTQIIEKEEPEVEQFTRVLNKLGRAIDDGALANSKLVESILALRDMYCKLTEIQRQDFVNQNGFLTVELLELEDQLVDVGLITPSDMLDRSGLKDPAKRLELASKIYRNLIFENYSELFNPGLYNVELRNAHKPKPTPSLNKYSILANSESTISFVDLSKCLYGLAKIASIKTKLNQPLKPVNQHWKEILPNIRLKPMIDLKSQIQISHDTTVLDYKYSQIWNDTFEFFQNIYPDILQTLNTKMDILDQATGLINLADAYGKAHLTKPIRVFLDKLKEIINDIPINQQLSLQTYMILLDCLNHLSTYDKTPFIQYILNYITLNHQYLSWEQNINVAHFLVINELDETQQYQVIMQNINSLNTESLSMIDLNLDLYHKLYDIYLSNQIKITTNIKISTLSQDLQKLVKSNAYGKNTPDDSVDPIQNMIITKLNDLEKDRFINLLPNILSSLPKSYLPNLFLPTDTSKIALFIGGSELMSYDENEISNITRFRANILEKFYPQAICKFISYNEYLNIDYHNAKLTFKQDKDINRIIQDVLPKNNDLERLSELSLKILDLFENYNQRLNQEIVESSQQTIRADMNRIELLIKELEVLYNLREEKARVFEMHQRTLYNDKIKYQLAIIDSMINSLPQNLKQQIEQNTNSSALLQDLKANFHTSTKEYASKFANLPWIGVLLKQELPLKPLDTQIDIKKKNVDIEILNNKFLIDNEYHHYASWKSMLNDSLTIHNLSFDLDQNIRKGHHNNNNGRLIIPATLPNPNKFRNLIRPTTMSWNWEYFAYQFPNNIYNNFLQKEILNLQNQGYLTENQKAIINLQNFKYELKAEFKNADIANMLKKFNFIEDLISLHLNIDQTKLNQGNFGVMLPRNPKDYFDYQELLSKKWLFKDKYSNFFIGEGLKQFKIKSMKNALNIKQKQLHKEYIEGKISLPLYRDSMRRMKREIVYKLEEIKNENPDKSDFASYAGKELKLNYDLETLLSKKHWSQLYSVDGDIDYIRSNGDLDKMMDLKRRKVETKLIKLRIIKKLWDNEALSSLENQYLQKWMSSLKSTNLTDLDMLMVPDKITSVRLGEISHQDQELLNTFNFFSFEQVQHITLNEFCLEFAHFYDDLLINRVEKLLKSKEIKQKWDISSTFNTDQAKNNEYNMLYHELSEFLWSKAGEFTPQNIQAIKNIFSVSRGSDKPDRLKHEVDQESLSDFIDNVNGYENRFRLLEQWIDKKETENNHINVDYDFIKSGLSFLRKDDFFSKIYKKKLTKKINGLLENLFGVKYDQISKNDIHCFAENLLERLYLLSKHMPQALRYILFGVLNHPNIASMDKANLLSALEWHKIDLELSNSPLTAISSAEIVGDKKIIDANIGNKDGFREKLNIANLPIVEYLANKLENV